MKKLLKRFSYLALVALLVLSFTACSVNEPTPKTVNNNSANQNANDPALEKLVNERGNAFEKQFENTFGSNPGGLNCDCKLHVDGTSLIVDCLLEKINDVPAETRAEMQKAYDATKAELAEGFKPIKDEAPNLTDVTLNVCEEDGDIITTVVMSF